jgi:hypothetical protein
LDLANLGKWPLSAGVKWDTAAVTITLGPLRKFVVARLREVEGRREGRLQSVDAREVSKTGEAVDLEGKAWRAYKEAMTAAQPELGTTDAVALELVAVTMTAMRLLDHLDEGERWENLYRCASCDKWFYAWKHDPQDRQTPYCGPSCWPSRTFRDVTSPPRRVQSRR